MWSRRVTSIVRSGQTQDCPRFLPSSKNPDDVLKQTMLQMENARMLSVFCLNQLFCPMDVCFPGGGWLSGWSWESLLLGAVPVLCPYCTEKPP